VRANSFPLSLWRGRGEGELTRVGRTADGPRGPDRFALAGLAGGTTRPPRVKLSGALARAAASLPAFLRFWLAEAISLGGDWFSLVAVSVLAVQRGGRRAHSRSA